MSHTLTDRVYVAIRDDILRCTLQPGQTVVQPELAAKYGVSMTPVREALRRLVDEGFVRSVPRFGYIVAPITLSSVSEIYEMRAIIEPAIVRLAAQRGTEEQLRKIAEAAPDLTGNATFHALVGDAAGNRMLADSLSLAYRRLTRVFHLILGDVDLTEEMRHAHVALANAICSRDPDLAERLSREEIASSRAHVMQSVMPDAKVAGSTALGQTVHLTQLTKSAAEGEVPIETTGISGEARVRES